MFPQQQLQQQLLHLQQLLQPPPAPPPSRGMTPPQQQQILNLRPAGQASLMSANPMLQRALLAQQLQGNLRGFNMAAAPVLQQFFPQATRHSLLGPPPVGVSLKPARLAFPTLLFPRQNRTFGKDFPKIPERKREADSASSSSQGQGTCEAGPVMEASDFQGDSELSSSLPSETPAESSGDGQPAAKRLRSKADEAIPEEIAEETDAKSRLEERDNEQKTLAGDSSDEKHFVEELKTSEVVNSGGSLKVTIQQSSESRAISTTALKPAHWTSEMGAAETSPESALKFYCYICKSDCFSQENFQSHMAGVQHQQRLRDIQHMSNLCFVSLLPVVKEQGPLAEKDGESQQRWCNTCHTHFTGDLIKHRRTPEHKLAKRSLRPFCTVCSRHFKTPRKFVEHMKSLAHKQKAKEVKLGEKEQGGPEDSEELITVDAVGCFEEEEEEEEEEEAGEEDDSEGEPQENEDSLTKQAGLKEEPSEDGGGKEEYCPDTVYGLDFLVPVAGFLCRLCHKFYHSDSAGRLTHCKSLMHFENLQRYKAMKLQASSTHAETSLHPQPELADGQMVDAAQAVVKTETAEAGEEEASLRGDCRSPRDEPASAAQTHSPVAFRSPSPVVEDGGKCGNHLASPGDGTLRQDAPGTGETAELPKPTAKPCDTTQQGVSADRVANETPDSRQQEKGVSSSAKGDSSSRRRSTRHKAR
ncbi:cip1-interacting zinc finger protein [Pogona vitticeps]